MDDDGALKGWDIRDRLHEIDVPTLVVRGRYDLCTEPIAGTLVNGVPNAREVVLEHSLHTPCSRRQIATSSSSAPSSARRRKAQSR